MHYVILAAGDYPTHPTPLELLRQADRVICCDGAAMAYIEHEGHAPWRIVGDGDSLVPELRESLANIIHQESEQDTNDLSKATRYAVKHGATRITYLGATGRREDHTLGNISLLVDYMRQGLQVEMCTDHGRFIPCHDVFQSELMVGCQLSIFSFGAKGFSADGLRYPLHDLTNWWQGTLNEVISPDVTITANGDFLVFVNY